MYNVYVRFLPCRISSRSCNIPRSRESISTASSSCRSFAVAIGRHRSVAHKKWDCNRPKDRLWQIGVNFPHIFPLMFYVGLIDQFVLSKLRLHSQAGGDVGRDTTRLTKAYCFWSASEVLNRFECWIKDNSILKCESEVVCPGPKRHQSPLSLCKL